MANQERRVAYVFLWVFALAFGWIEAAVVVYLREISAREGAFLGTASLPNAQVALAALPGRLVALEIVREACTLALLAAVGWLAGRRPAGRIGAFVAAFGVWDLTYYAVLRLVLGWPDSLGAWDILFLIPVPWVAPVWAPVAVATLFVLAGSYLFWTADHERRYRWIDVGVLLISACLILAAFLSGSATVVDHRLPERFPAWLFWSGVALATAWFVSIERRVVRTGEGMRPVGVRVRTIAPTEASPTGRIETPIARATSGEPGGEGDITRVVAAYREAQRREDALAREAGDLAERLERLAHGLSRHPRHMIIGVPADRIEEPAKWDIVPSHPLPSIEQLAALTNDLRGVSASVDELRERLILMGHAELVEQADGFFH